VSRLRSKERIEKYIQTKKKEAEKKKKNNCPGGWECECEERHW
jgi:hypothetical protein